MQFYKLSPEEYLRFHISLREARENNNHGCFVSLESPEYYAQTENYLMGDGVAGFAIKQGDLIAVHKNTNLAKNAMLTLLFKS